MSPALDAHLVPPREPSDIVGSVQGHLVIADISGYTQFLTTSELDHANGIIGELLNGPTRLL